MPACHQFPPSPPPAQAPRAVEVCLRTRLPGAAAGYGKVLTLAARDPRLRWDHDTAQGLIAQLPAARAALAQSGPGGLLVGVLPYPGGNSQATALLFDRHDRLPGDAVLPIRPEADGPFRLTSPFRPDRDADGYQHGVRRVLDYLLAGDAYQVNLAQHFSATSEGHPRALYRHLARRFDPPYAAWIDLGHEQVLCLSPESFLELDGDRVLTRPIKGTRPRGHDTAADEAIRRELALASKDRAENLMIVDLLRNDLGKVCVPGSVQVPSLFAVESFRNVHHLVSLVEGRLATGAGVPELLAACFPGGSITGAPKRRAMEIINELEPHPRDIYCGSIFWLTGDGRFGSNITIRTLLARDGRLHCWGGAGIVADSEPAAEYQECLDKVGPIMRECENQFLKM